MARQSFPPEVATRPLPAAGRAADAFLSNLLISLRPHQWTKNLIVFAALIFGRELFEPLSLWRTIAAFAIFCTLSSAVYLLNDLADQDADRNHPLKAGRPIASGVLSTHAAAVAAVSLGGTALGASFWLGLPFGLVASAYGLLQLAYSYALKHVVILDVLTIASGFVLRAVAGAVVIDVPMSNWLLVCTILLALFIALSKRRHELVLLADGATSHRRILEEYNPYLLDQMISVVTASTLMAYAFYAISPETADRFGTDRLGLTIGFPLYGIFRYLYLVHRREEGGSPSETLLNDRPLLVCVVLWAAAVVLIIYRPFSW